MESLPMRVPANWSSGDYAALAAAKRRLEHPSLALTLAAVFGKPLEGLLHHLPRSYRDGLGKTVEAALFKALDVALFTLGSGSPRSHEWLHKLAVTTTGAAGGAFGLASASIELPISTRLPEGVCAGRAG
jgi:hypothetical protein